MPIDASRNTPHLPTYTQSMSAQARNPSTLPPPAYEHPPAYTEKASSSSSYRANSGVSSSLTANRINNQQPANDQAMRGMRMMGGFFG